LPSKALICNLQKVRFALSSASIFSHTDKTTDSERFYLSLFDLLDDAREKRELDALFSWWNMYVLFQTMNSFESIIEMFIHRKVFPHVSPEAVEVPIEESALDRIRQVWAEQELLDQVGDTLTRA
jgi:hypothetical protein